MRGLKSVRPLAFMLCLGRSAIGVMFALQMMAGAVEAADTLPIVFVHGFCSTSEKWDPIIADLQPSERFGNGVTYLYLNQDEVRHLNPRPDVHDEPASSMGSNDSSKVLFAI